LITTADFKLFARIDTSSDDTLIDQLILGATDFVEKWTQRSLLGQTWVYTERRWPRRIVELPRPPLVSVTSVGYVDTAGDDQTLVADTDYVVTIDREPGIIEPAYGKTWPSLRGETAQAITVTYVAGFHADDPDEVPNAIRIAVKMLAAQWYRCPEPSVPERTSEVPYGFRELLRQWRIESVRDHLPDA
jgi:uncharacterized phiE125 gp8 family phage protein